MSKGGAGKVYFVLYLAVILELLIIIVERDEAEEHLMAKQRESMKIVQSILAQLQTGAGVEGLSTRPQDQIVLTAGMPPGTPGLEMIAQDRVYQVDVGVTDVIGDLPKIEKDQNLDDKEKKQRLKDFVVASNVRELQYQVWFTNSKDSVPKFPPDDAIAEAIKNMKGSGFRETTIPGYNWTLKGYATMVLDPDWLGKADVPTNGDATRNWFTSMTTAPVYKIAEAVGAYPSFAPEDKVKKPQYEYNHAATIANGGGEGNLKSLKVRTFSAGFKPSGSDEGIYKLHFFSRTNKIMGIKSGNGSTGVPDLADDSKVNIGTLQLKVKDLKSVLTDLDRDADPRVKQLTQSYVSNTARSPKKYRDEVQKIVDELNVKDPDKANNAKLYGYINMILYGGSEELEQNQASMGFTIRVMNPKIPQAQPCISDLLAMQKVYTGIKKVLIPLTVNNQKQVLEPKHIVVTPQLESTSSIKVVPVPSKDASSKNVSYVIELYNLQPASDTDPATYTVTIKPDYAKMCDENDENYAKVVVYPAGLTNPKSPITKIENLRYGSAPKFKFEPKAGGAIPAGDYLMTFILDGNRSEPIPGRIPLQFEGPCISKALSSFGVEFKWIYKVPGVPQYSDEIILFSQSTNKAAASIPEIDLETAVTKFDDKTKTITISNIRVILPAMDCDKSAPVMSKESDVTVNVEPIKVSNAKFKHKINIVSTEATGNGTYKVTLKLKGPQKNPETVTVPVTITVSLASQSLPPDAKPVVVTIPKF